MSSSPIALVARSATRKAYEIPYRLLHPPREVEILLGISHAHLYRLIRAGRLSAVMIGSRTGITRSSIEAVAAGEAR
jgi:excisionase family DNA binding protein